MNYEELNLEKLTTKVEENTGDVLKKMVQYDYEITWVDLNLKRLRDITKKLKHYIKKDLKKTHKVDIKISDLYDHDFHINTSYGKYKQYIRWWIFYNPEQTTVD